MTLDLDQSHPVGGGVKLALLDVDDFGYHVREVYTRGKDK